MTRVINQQNISHWNMFAVLLVAAMFCSSVQAFHFYGNGNGKQALRLSTQDPAATTTGLFASRNNKQETTATKTVTAMPTRTVKHHKRGKKRATKKTAPANRKRSDRPLSEEDLRQHVAAQYYSGPGGVMRSAFAKEKVERQEARDQEHVQHIHKLNRHPALVLNADYQPISYLPLSMWHWQEAIKAVFSGKVTVVDVYPDVTIRAANLEIPLPSVIALNEYVPQPNSKPAFTKRNVFLRDEYRCQYCNHHFHTRELSLDHVMPRCMGGRLNWENAVTSCRKCNGRKGSLKVNQLKNIGMRLLKEPYTPTQFQLHSIAGQMLPRKVHPSWAPYLGLVDHIVTSSSGAQNQAGEREGIYFDDLP